MDGMIDEGAGDTGTKSDRLAGLLEAARMAGPMDRIGYRDALAAVTGAYSFAVPYEVEDFGHITPVKLLQEDINRHDVHVTDALRRAISLQPRLYEITPYGGDVEVLVGST
jgi:hypothetical protein